MKFTPYLQFNGNCAEAIAFYENAFGIKAEVYKKDDGFINHAEFDFGDGCIGLSDTPPDEEQSTFGNGGISISVSLDDTDEVKSVFEKLGEGGKVFEKPEKTEWCECFCTLEDKFGVNWSLMCGEDGKVKMFHSGRLANFDADLEKELAARPHSQLSWDAVNNAIQWAASFTLDTDLTLEILLDSWKQLHCKKGN